jgi:hypothetical protein
MNLTKYAWRTAFMTLFSASAQTAFADIFQVHCGSQEGLSYYPGVGWVEDGVPGGEIIYRIDTSSVTVAVRFKDVSGVWNDVEDVGGTAGIFAVTDNSLGVLVVYASEAGGSVETTLLSSLDTSIPVAVISTTKVRDLLPLGRTLVAECTGWSQ